MLFLKLIFIPHHHGAMALQVTDEGY